MKTAWNEHFNIIGQMRSFSLYTFKKSPSECGFYPFLYIYQVNDEYSKGFIEPLL